MGLGTGRRGHWEHGERDAWTTKAGQDLCVSVWNLQGALWGLEAETARSVFRSGDSDVYAMCRIWPVDKSKISHV